MFTLYSYNFTSCIFFFFVFLTLREKVWLLVRLVCTTFSYSLGVAYLVTFGAQFVYCILIFRFSSCVWILRPLCLSSWCCPRDTLSIVLGFWSDNCPSNQEFSTSECHYGDRHICQLCGVAFSGFSLTTGVTEKYELCSPIWSHGRVWKIISWVRRKMVFNFFDVCILMTCSNIELNRVDLKKIK